MTQSRTTRRVLIIGRVAAVNQRVVGQLALRGYTAVGAAGEGLFPELDAGEFDLVAIGAGVDAVTRADLKRRFQVQHPGVLLLDVYGPLAAEQIEDTMRRSEGVPRCLESLVVEDGGEWRLVRVTVHRPCHLQLDVYRHRGSPEPNIAPIASARVIAGTHLFAVAQAFTGEGHMLVLRTDDEVEVHRLFG